jgi:acetoin utilization deacetylase AcuC-like enzyme
MALGLIHDPLFQEHDPGSYHCESPNRLVALDQALRLWPGLDKTVQIPLREAKIGELTLSHMPHHIKRVASTHGKRVALDPDTGACPVSYRVALNAVGSLMDLCKMAVTGDIKHGAAFIRPPGHHATPDRAMGFCFFNNVALAATHLIHNCKLNRILVVDFDVHHGNGTEEIFYYDHRVLYFSLHQSPFYPGTGPVNSVGLASGKGYTLNAPLPAGQGDQEYIRIFEDLLLPVARQYKPEFILVSAGYDAHRDDPLGGMHVSSLGFAALTRILMEISDDFCPGKIVLSLEGGYDPPALGRSVVACLEALTGNTKADALRKAHEKAEKPQALIKALKMAANFWSFP